MTALPSASDDTLPRNAANHQPLTPLGFLAWAAAVYLSLIHI